MNDFKKYIIEPISETTGKDNICCDAIKIVEFNQTDKILPANKITEQNDLFICVRTCQIVNYLAERQYYIPANIIDIGVEARNLRNGLVCDDSPTLEQACVYYGIETSKRITDQMAELFRTIMDQIDFPLAILRGNYLKALAVVERNGIPIDFELYNKLMENRIRIRRELIDEIDMQYNVYENYSFNQKLFCRYLHRNKIEWPITETGKPDLRDETFKEMVSIYPQIAPLRELRKLLTNLQDNNLTIGDDGRNRTQLIPFKAKTGRNQPKTSRYIFGQSKSLRSIIKPPPGRALAYIDWSQQEFGIAAALSGDKNMQKAYQDGDPYLYFAKLANAIPENATKQSHPEIRKNFKECILAVQYGMGSWSLAERIKRTESYARYLLECHRKMFPDYWAWLDDVLNHVKWDSQLYTQLGWNINISSDTEINERSLGNFPIQATAAEILRIATIMMTEHNIKICTTVFDAFLIESNIDTIEEDTSVAKNLMEKSGMLLLNDFKLRSDVKTYRHPDHFEEPDGSVIWQKLLPLILKN